MIISDMNATFGNLENSTLSLSEGLNIIDGANETGKSTWCAFIRSMLYGVSSSERDSKVSLAVKNRYRPWSGSSMSGTMKAHTEEFGELTLERRTTTPSAPMRDFQAYSPLGEEISLSYTDVGEQLLGIDLSCFERSAFIETPRLPFGGTSELERRILALVSSGEEKSSYTDARSVLEGWQRKLEFRGNGKIPELEQRIRLLKSDLDICKRNSAELDDVQLKILSLESERVALLKNIAEMKTEFNDSIRDRVQAAQTRLINARQEVLDASEMLPSGDPIPTVDELRMLEQRFFFEQEKKRTAQAQSALQREKLRRLDEYRLHLSEHKPFGGCTAKEAKDIVTKDINKLTALTVGGISRSIFLKLSPFLLVSLAVSVLMLIMSRELIGGIPSWVIPALLILVSPFILIVSSRSKAKKRIDTITKAVLEKYGAKSQDEILQILNSYVALIDEYTRMKDDADSNLRSSQTEKSSEDVISRIMNIFPTFNNAAEIEGGLSDAVHSAVTAIDNYNRRITERNNAEELLNALRADWFSDSDSMPQYSYIPDDISAELERNETELSALRRQKALLEGSLSHIRDSSELEHDINQAQQRIDKMRMNFSAITFALDTLSDAYKLIRERFSPRLNEETADIFSALTLNKYSRVIINKEFEAMAGGGTSDGLRRALELSSGTVDQLYLALRLAICKTVLPPGNRVPIILDDALLTFDDKRMASALEWLYNDSKDRQIIIFTCHKREGAYLKNRPGVNIQSLSPSE